MLPLAPLFIVSAIVAGVVSDISWPACAAVAVAAASAAVVVPQRWRLWCVAAMLCALCAAWGAAARDRALQSPLSDALASVLDDRFAPPVLVSGTLRDDSAVEADGARVSIDVDAVKVGGAAAAWLSVDGRAQFNVGGAQASSRAAQWTRGRRITVPALVRRPQVWRNPGALSERWQRLRRGVDVTGSVKSAGLVVVSPGPPWAEWAARIRAHVRSSLSTFAPPGAAESAAIVSAILIGDRTGLDDETTRRLQMAGTYHVIAISGGNIAIVAVTCLWLLRLFVRSPRLTALLVMFVVITYGFIVGSQASVARAVTAGAVVLSLQVIGWCAPPARILLLAAAIVSLADPMAVIDVGAWLSFGAAAGILLGAERLTRIVSIRPGAIVSWSAAMLAATLAAELALMPITAAVFARVSVAGLLLNFIAIPAMTVAQLAGTAVVLLVGVSPWLARIAAVMANAGSSLLTWSAHLLDIAPWLSWQTPPVSLWWIAAYYAGAAALLFGAPPPTRRRVAGAECAASLLVILISPRWASAESPPPRGTLRISMLDVGQGQAIVIQFPTGESLLLDAGGSPSAFDIGARVIEPALWGLGIQRLDWVGVTHGDVDHAGGAPGVVRDMRPREVWEGIAVPRDQRMQALRERAHAQNIVWRRLNTGHSFEVGSVAVDVLNPALPDWERRDSRNDDSLVMEVRYGDVAFILAGDIERAAEAELQLNRAPRLRLLSVPHHGSRTSSTPALLRRWMPHAAFVSAGRGNTFGHPAPDVLARYENLDVDVFRTDLDGAITIDTDGRTVSVETMAGRKWRLSAAEFR